MIEIEPNLCKINGALEVLTGKWKVLILMNIMESSPLRFNELRRRIPEITQKMLTQQLRELEEEDVIQRKVYPEVPPHVEYSVTTYGETLFPILNAMHEWGENHQKRKLHHNKPVSKG